MMLHKKERHVTNDGFPLKFVRAEHSLKNQENQECFRKVLPLKDAVLRF